MAVYWFTLAAVGYFLLTARLLDPALNEREFGRLPERPTSRVFVTFAALVLVAVGSLRWGVGTDFFTYVGLYEKYKISFVDDLRNFDEPGAKGLAFVVGKVYDDPAAFFFATSVITIGLMLYTLAKYSIAIEVSYFLFVFVGVWHGSFNAVRQFLACAIILAAHRFLMDRKRVKYAAMVALASVFHISAVVMIALLLIPNRRLRAPMLLLLGGVAVAGLYGSGAILEAIESVRGSALTSDYVLNQVNPLRVAVAVAPVLLYWTAGVSTEADGRWFYRNMAVVHAVVMLGASGPYLARFALYTMVFLPLIIPRLIDFRDRRLTIVVRVAAVLLYGLFWYTEVSGSSSLREFEFVLTR